jgi:quercetin dioxygenase-like cupin family protein
MKKIVILCSVIMTAAALFVFAAKEKKPDEHSKSAATVTEHQIMAPSDLKWGEPPPGLPAGAKVAVLNGDPTKAGPFTVRMQASAGYKILPHTHPTPERLTVISGTFRIGMGDKFDEAATQEMGPGSYLVLPAGMTHFVSLNSDSIVQVDTEGPFRIKYVNPADDPRNAKK